MLEWRRNECLKSRSLQGRTHPIDMVNVKLSVGPMVEPFFPTLWQWLHCRSCGLLRCDFCVLCLHEISHSLMDGAYFEGTA